MEAGLLQRQWKGTAYWLAFPLLLTLSYSISHHDLAPPSQRINLVNGLQLDLMVAFSQLRYHPLWLLYLVTSWHTKPARTGNIFSQLPHSIPSPHRVIAISKCKNSLSLILKVPIVYHIHKQWTYLCYTFWCSYYPSSHCIFLFSSSVYLLH